MVPPAEIRVKIRVRMRGRVRVRVRVRGRVRGMGTLRRTALASIASNASTF